MPFKTNFFKILLSRIFSFLLLFKKYAKTLKKLISERIEEDEFLREMNRIDVHIMRTVRVIKDRNNSFQVGSNVFIGDYTVIHVTDDPKFPGGCEGSSLFIGEGTYIGEMNNIRAGGGNIKIGRDCLISQNVSIVASNHGIDRERQINEQPWNVKGTGVEIHDDVWIGSGAVILPGSIIRRGAVIGANSVVTNEIPEYAIAFGVPAKVIRYRE